MPFGLTDLALGPIGSYVVDKIIGDGTNEKIDSYTDDGNAETAWSNSRHDRVTNDPTNQDLDAAAAEHYLYGRKEAMDWGKYGPNAALGGAALNAGLTVGYDGAKALGFLVKDYVSEDLGDAALKGLVETTAGVEDTLPSRPTLSSTVAGIKGGFDGAGESIANTASNVWNYFAD